MFRDVFKTLDAVEDNNPVTLDIYELFDRYDGQSILETLANQPENPHCSKVAAMVLETYLTPNIGGGEEKVESEELLF